VGAKVLIFTRNQAMRD